MPKGSDLAYINNLHSEFESHCCYVKGDDRRQWEKAFGLKHYAGCVNYAVEGFVEKNRDVQQDVLFDFMSRSSNEFVQELSVYQDLLSCMFGGRTNNATTMSRGTSKGKPTLCDSFRHQLQALVDVLQATTPWYVRCIKPNSDKLANHYDEKLVLDQLKYLGMLDIIRIRKEGYPVHISFIDFIQRYYCLANKTTKLSTLMSTEPTQAVMQIMQTMNLPATEWQIGKSKVFLRRCVHEPIEDARNTLITTNAILIQTVWRAFISRRGKQCHANILSVIQQRANPYWSFRVQTYQRCDTQDTARVSWMETANLIHPKAQSCHRHTVSFARRFCERGCRSSARNETCRRGNAKEGAHRTREKSNRG